jgi:hypothetical protein
MMPARRMPRACSAIVRSVVVFACLAASVACSVGTVAVPLEQPFALVPDQRVHGRFAVRKQGLYAVELVYPFDNPEQRRHAWDLAGGSGRQARGAELTVRVQVGEIREGRSRLLRRRDVMQPALTSWSADTLHSELVRLPLSPGIYTFDVRVVAAAPALRKVPVRIAVREAYTGK